jgi:hypothetical protein
LRDIERHCWIIYLFISFFLHDEHLYDEWDELVLIV